VLVPVTWFFREPGAFAMLGTRVAAWLSGTSARQRRLLSVPCSTGEEPYSMAISLLDAGLAPDAFHVDAVDVSRHALAAARAASYEPRALRHTEPALRDRYFDRLENGFRVRSDVRRCVTFRYGNLVDPALLASSPPYDVVFCRNVLIYFGQPARARVLDAMARLVGVEGVLVTGHAEGQSVVAPTFVSVGLRGVFAYRKVERAEGGRRSVARQTGLPPPRSRRTDAPALRPAPGAARSPSPAATRDVTPIARAQGDDRRAADRGQRAGQRDQPSVHDEGRAQVSLGSSGLDDVTHLADAGRLDEARRRCAEIIARQPALADAHYLMGVVELALGRRPEAEAAFRRAIYLDPHHERALTCLALERERQGDHGEAERLRRRARGKALGARG
jgi:chemotaxis protein methyltransferase WspC